MNDYDPKLQILREMLALSIMGKLEDCGFSESGFDDKTREKVYSRNIPSLNIDVKVYTTIVGREVRREGKDAIRVCATYTAKDGKSRGIVKSTRVNRTGNIADITQRMHARMRETWKAASTGEKCHACGAPKFTTKANKKVCADICWLTDDEKQASDMQWKLKASAKRHRTGYNRRYR